VKKTTKIAIKTKLKKNPRHMQLIHECHSNTMLHNRYVIKLCYEQKYDK